MPNIWNGTMLGDLEWPLNASRGLSATADFLVDITKGLEAAYAGSFFDDI